jgi:hypothetical protein
MQESHDFGLGNASSFKHACSASSCPPAAFQQVLQSTALRRSAHMEGLRAFYFGRAPLVLNRFCREAGAAGAWPEGFADREIEEAGV